MKIKRSIFVIEDREGDVLKKVTIKKMPIKKKKKKYKEKQKKTALHITNQKNSLDIIKLY